MKLRSFKVHKKEDNQKAKPPVLYDLAVYVISWGRPHLLEETLSSIFEQSKGIHCCVSVVDNGSDSSVKEVIAKYLPKLHRVYLHTQNLGVSLAWESILYHIPEAKYLMFSDGDMKYNCNLSKYTEFLNSNSADACGGQHSPEHLGINMFNYNNDTWIHKRMERGCHVVISAERLYKMRPFMVPTGVKIAWDDWVMSNLSNFAVLSGGATHLGAKESTWQKETPEYTEQQLRTFKI